MKENFAEAVGFVLAHEGGYVNDPKDTGGETKYGISKRAYPRVDIKNLTKAQARDIYYRDYWKRVDGDNLPAGLDLAVFDTAVNCGVSVARSFLQATKSVGEYIDLRRKRYYRLVDARPPLARFLRGWLNRLNDLSVVVGKIMGSDDTKNPGVEGGGGGGADGGG